MKHEPHTQAVYTCGGTWVWDESMLFDVAPISRLSPHFVSSGQGKSLPSSYTSMNDVLIQLLLDEVTLRLTLKHITSFLFASLSPLPYLLPSLPFFLCACLPAGIADTHQWNHHWGFVQRLLAQENWDQPRLVRGWRALQGNCRHHQGSHGRTSVSDHCLT